MLRLNGNYLLYISRRTGTKIRLGIGKFKPKYLESIDLKITDKCNNKCEYCYENSSPNGEHATIENLFDIINMLEPGTEIAIGGGNPLEYIHLYDLLEFCKYKHMIPNMTINIQDYVKKFTYINYLLREKLIYGLGISYNDNKYEHVLPLLNNRRIVIHTIIGYNDASFITTIGYRYHGNILLLGFKNTGRAIVDNEIQNNIEQLSKDFYLLYNLKWKQLFKTIALDTLAVQQLNLDKGSIFYMGEEGEFTCYIDAVKGIIKRSSYDSNSYDIPNNLEIRTLHKILGVSND